MNGIDKGEWYFEKSRLDRRREFECLCLYFKIPQQKSFRFIQRNKKVSFEQEYLL